MRFRANFARFENWIEEGADSFVEQRVSKLNPVDGPAVTPNVVLSGGTADYTTSSDEPTPF
jgi:hypothetical protein